MKEEPVAIRPAKRADLDVLDALEQSCFSHDRISRRSFRHFLKAERSTLLVAEEEAGIVGYILVTYRAKTDLARLYSLAVYPASRGKGVARSLILAGETEARERGCLAIRLEVHPGNNAANALYNQLGYRQFATVLDYYEDHGDALRLEKPLIRPSGNSEAPKYYAQTSDFTCGPAAMMMAMKALEPDFEYGRATEFRLWREATTVFTQAGHGGCEPFGMAVALSKWGFNPEIYVNREPPYFMEGLRSPDRREVLALIQRDYRSQAEALGIPISFEALSRQDLSRILSDGAHAIVLVSLFHMVASRTPHWVFVYQETEDHFMVHDPWVERDDWETETVAAALPIPKTAFEKMSQWGRGRLRAALVVRKGSAS